ncbi:hypothetical protein LEP1GSC061_2439 [Leptospira wolffii serovar Khorat str. Khorat-H2]|nr:hypothetical protein LEP1GSC061_2439 [Leptospira wolffii serovar Khorat str. Khorat-H2]
MDFFHRFESSGFFRETGSSLTELFSYGDLILKYKLTWALNILETKINTV